VELQNYLHGKFGMNKPFYNKNKFTETELQIVLYLTEKIMQNKEKWSYNYYNVNQKVEFRKSVERIIQFEKCKKFDEDTIYDIERW
jgi:hypothetical protein